MRLSSLLLLIVATATATATPAQYDGEAVERRNDGPNRFCKTVKKVVTAAKQHKAATKFCSSYLSITATTTTVTSTTTVAASITCADPALVTKRALTTEKPTLEIDPRAVAVEKRADAVAKKPVPKPSCFSSYTESPIISSACSCLSIRPSTVTSTTTSTTTTGAGVLVTPASFYLLGSGGGGADGKYANTKDATFQYSFFIYDRADAELFSLTPTGQLLEVSTNPGFIANGAFAPDDANSVLISFQSAADLPGRAVVTCSIAAGSDGVCTLNCVSLTRTASYACYSNNFFALFDPARVTADDLTVCRPFTVLLVPGPV